MKIKELHIPLFKNLKDFHIVIESEKTENVILWKNATWKSNFFEALILIFKSLDLAKSSKPKELDIDFDYTIWYECNWYNIQIEKKWLNYEFYVWWKKLKNKEFFDSKNIFLPKNLFTYYSWVNKRVEWYFDDHQKKFYDQLIKEWVEQPERPFFFARLIHSLYVMLAFYSFEDEEINDFLKKQFWIIWIESVLFKVQTPERSKWDKRKKYFWSSGGLVWKFLEQLYDISLAPIKTSIKYKDNFRSQKEKNWVYLFVNDIDKLKELAKTYWWKKEFFSVLESTYISDLIYDIKIKVKKEKDWEIYFQELSEWEQQLLVVLWLLIFTWDKESLILLDEPDTHLNPRWKWDYIDIINKYINKPEWTQILMTTHDPLVIGWLDKDQILIFSKKEDKTIVNNPDFEVKWLGVAWILTSELFELPTTLDRESEEKIIKFRVLESKRINQKISKEEIQELKNIEKEVDLMWFNTESVDSLFKKFLSAVMSFEEFQKIDLSDEEIKRQNKIAIDVINKLK